MKLFFTLFLFDILLGYVPQAAGCAVCLYTFTRQRLKTKSFLTTSLIFAIIAVIVRLICNYGLIDFGFHTVLIWMLFAIVAIIRNKFPILQSTVSILFSGILIVATELITYAVLSAIIGSDRLNAIMDNTATIEGQIERAKCGIPMNVLFVALSVSLYFIMKYIRSKKAAPVEQPVDEVDSLKETLQDNGEIL